MLFRSQTQAGHFVGTRAAVVHEQQHGVIPATKNGVLIRRLQQSLHLGFVEVIDHPLCRLLEWNGTDLGAPGQMLRCVRADEVGQRPNGRQTLVAGDDAAMTLALQVCQERADAIWVI